jgi:hypothetical protein
MKKNTFIIGIIACAIVISCSSPTTQKTTATKPEKAAQPGTYGYDVAFMKEHQMDFVELRDENGKARLMVSPALQGRVMTSSANAEAGKSFGWINYKLINSGKVSQQFNPYGGEERFWLGPEGGPNSIYFAEGKEQVFENWKVPSVIDTEPFEIKLQSQKKIEFTKAATLKNVAGTEFSVLIDRKIWLLNSDTLESLFDVKFPKELQMIAYQSENSITNKGNRAWSKSTGLLSVWMLSMFNPSPATTVFIPYRKEGSGQIVNDDYFGKVPADRLKAENGLIYFKIDGKLRSKIGISPERATELCGSYDSDQKVLTLLWCSLPEKVMPYVNSKWGKQDDPFKGDAINSYNDGPVADGSIMGPFYEVETSSPAAALAPGETMKHIQRIVHLQGEEPELSAVINALFHIDLQTIKSQFQK